jgi:hypothetical protein
MLQSAILNKMLPKGFKLESNERTKHHGHLKIESNRFEEQQSPTTMLGKRTLSEAVEQRKEAKNECLECYPYKFEHRQKPTQIQL